MAAMRVFLNGDDSLNCPICLKYLLGERQATIEININLFVHNNIVFSILFHGNINNAFKCVS